MVLPVAVVACRQELHRNRQTAESSRKLMTTVNGATALVLVVTDIERDAVLAAVRKLTGKEPAPDHGPRTAFLLGSVGDVQILLAQAGEQGTASAAAMLVSAVKLLEHLDPDYVILTGICYGLRPDEGQRIGDIVIGRRVQGVDHRKVTETDVVNRGVNVPCSPRLLTCFQSAQVSWTASQVHVGTVLSSNTLVNSRSLVDELRGRFPDAIAGEMEGLGLSEATMDDFKPDWIVVKAISDWGYDKTNERQSEAAGNVAAFVVRVLASGALARRRPQRGTEAGSGRRIVADIPLGEVTES
jgi:nucleoside phosphorylase